MNLKVIAYARNGHSDKFGIPRQSREESPICTRIVFEPEYSVPEALRGIEGYSHLWLIWGFSETYHEQVKTTLKPGNNHVQPPLSWSPTVRPPRLGGNKRMGVFATRSPFRPNPIGLSSVKLIKVERTDGSLELLVSGADLLDGTPIYDIKPYLSFSDSHPEAQNGFAEQTKDYHMEVDWSFISRSWKDIGSIMPRKWLEDTTYILSQDPRPAYQDDPQREYKLDYAGYTITFTAENGTIFVKNIQKIQK